MSNKVSIFDIQAKKSWLKWLRMPLRDEYEEVWKVHEWIHSLCVNGIIPMLHKYGYVINVSEKEFINCTMNYMYKWYNHNAKGHISCVYRCKCKKNNATEDDEWYFHSMRVENEKWEDLKKLFFIEDYADDSEFAYRLWNDIPFFVFKHININDSPATSVLDEMMTYEDDENNSDNDGYNRVDPYIADYS